MQEQLVSVHRGSLILIANSWKQRPLNREKAELLDFCTVRYCADEKERNMGQTHCLSAGMRPLSGPLLDRMHCGQ